MVSIQMVEQLDRRPQHSSIISVGRGLVCLRGVVAHHFGFSSRRPGFESRREHHDNIIKRVTVCHCYTQVCQLA